MKRWKIVSLICLAGVVLLAGFAAFALPGILKTQTVRRVEAATGRTLGIGAVSINPFTLTITVRDVRFSEPGSAESFAAFSSARIALSPAALYRRAPVVAAARISAPRLRIVRTGANRYNFSDLRKFLPKHPRLSVSNLTVQNGSLDVLDSLPPGGFSTELAGISLDLRDYSTSPGKRAGYALSFTTARGEQAELKGEFSPRPWAGSARGRLSGIPLEVYSPYLAWVGRSEVQGSFNFAGNLDFGGPQGLRLDQFSVQARPFATLVGGKARISGSSLALAGGSYDRKQNLLQVTQAHLKGGEIRLSRLRTGGLRPLARQPRQGTLGKPNRSAPFRYRIVQLTGSGMNAFITDERLAAPPGFLLKNVDFSLEQLAGPHFGPTPFRAAGSYGKSGSLNASGTVSQTPLNATGKLALQGMPLGDLASYLPERLHVTVADGALNARLSGSLTSRAHRLTGSFGGSAQLHSLSFLDPEGRDLMKLDTLQIDQAKVGLAPYTLQIGALLVTRLRTQIVIAENGSLNLQELYNRKPEGNAPQSSGVAQEKVSIGTLTLQDGTIAFTDRHVRGGYATTLFQLGGRISGLSSEENRLAELDLYGNLENRSPLRITGQVSPLRQELFADIKVSFAGIELPPMTPYSGTYLGYAVDRGKLFLDSRYRIKNRQLNSENHVFIDQLDLGKSIPSDKATNLPVRLAVALLKDRKGEIRLDLPVLGETDDPHFSLWKVVLKALKGLVAKAASSPLALLRAVFGGKEDLASVGFAPGSAALSAGEQQKLLKLAQTLDDRPALQVKTIGYVDREPDSAGYRNETLLKKMRAEKYRALVQSGKNNPGDAPDTVQIGAGEYGRYLRTVYDKEGFPKPRNLLGLAKALPDAEMKQLILGHIPVGEPQLRSLADARAAAVSAFLVAKGGLAATRVTPGSGDIYRAPTGGVAPASRVELEFAAN